MLQEHHRFRAFGSPRSSMCNTLDTKYKVVCGIHSVFFNWVPTIHNQLTLGCSKEATNMRTVIKSMLSMSPCCTYANTVCCQRENLHSGSLVK